MTFDLIDAATTLDDDIAPVDDAILTDPNYQHYVIPSDGNITPLLQGVTPICQEKTITAQQGDQPRVSAHVNLIGIEEPAIAWLIISVLSEDAPFIESVLDAQRLVTTSTAPDIFPADIINAHFILSHSSLN